MRKGVWSEIRSVSRSVEGFWCSVKCLEHIGNVVWVGWEDGGEWKSQICMGEDH